MSAARRLYGRLGAVAVIFVIAGLTGAARADEPADRGISLSAWAGGAIDRGVRTADGRPVHPEGLIAGLTGVGNIERVAIGGAVDMRPALFGDRWLSLSALLGYQQQVGRARLQLLGEVEPAASPAWARMSSPSRPQPSRGYPSSGSASARPGWCRRAAPSSSVAGCSPAMTSSRRR